MPGLCLRPPVEEAGDIEIVIRHQRLGLKAGNRPVGRIVLALDGPTFDSLKLGHRWMGEAIVKARHVPHGVAIHTGGFDRGRDELYAAIRRHWPPAAAEAEADTEGS